MTVLERLTQVRDRLQADALLAMARGRPREADDCMDAARALNMMISTHFGADGKPTEFFEQATSGDLK